MKIDEFTNTLASNKPAPGGGSVSALAGANGCGLMIMAGELSFHKKKFKALDEGVQNTFKKHIEFFESSKEKFLSYIDEDTKAFNQLMDAFRLPKDNEKQKEARSIAIQKATMESIRVPMEVCQLSIESLRHVEVVMNDANRNTISDQGVGVMMLHTALEGSAMNVLINLSGLKDDRLSKEYRKEVQLIQEEARQLRQKLLDNVKL